MGRCNLLRRTFSETVLALLLVGTLALTVNIQPIRAETKTWTVDDDGLADFHTIQEAINAASPGDTVHVYSGIYNEQVIVNKSVGLVGDETNKQVINTTGASPPVINGTCSTVRISANNVTVSGFVIQNFIDDWGIFLNHSSNNIINGNIVKALTAILVDGGSGNAISDNKIVQLKEGYCVFDGLRLANSNDNVVTGNYFSGYCHNALTLDNSSNNYVAFNYIAGHFSPFPFTIYQSDNNSIVGNAIWKSLGHMYLGQSSGNVLYHNSFLPRGSPVTVSTNNASMNRWDNGYPSGGNYWGDYGGMDLYNGLYQNETGSDGIGDTPYIIDQQSRDDYPLTTLHDIGIVRVTASKTVVTRGYSLNISVEIVNYGTDAETFNVTAYANMIPIVLQTETLPSGNSKTITFIWNTIGWAKGNYTISACALSVSGEIDTANNQFDDCWVSVVITGDINDDGKVDIKDVYKVAQAYGSSSGDPRWNAVCDMNDDKKVDIKDYYFVCKHFGESSS
jgi:nitrous oxidase accessory protein NosD